MADRAAIALLRLPHHGGPRDLVCPSHVGGRILALASKAPPNALGSLGVAAQLPSALHREHRWLDDRRTGPPTLAYLRAHAHERGLFEHGLGQQRPVYSD